MKTDLRDYPSSFLGSSEISLLELTRAYATLANGGRGAPAPSLVSRIATPSGALAYTLRPKALQRAMEPSTAHQIAALMKDRSKMVGRSGTTYGFTDGWYVGFNGRFTCGVWVGFDQPRKIADNAFGSVTAKPIWESIMGALEPTDLPRVAQETEEWEHICLKSGKLAGPSCHHHSCRMPLNIALGQELGFCVDHEGKDANGLKTMRAIPIIEYIGASAISAKSPVVMGDDPFRK